MSASGMIQQGLNTRVGPMCRTVEDAARILLESPRSPLEIENVVAETTTVAGVAALLRGGNAPDPVCTFSSPFEYRHRLADYL